jgi:putative oxidoreductase
MPKLLFKREPLWSEAIFPLRVWTGVTFAYHGIICFDAEGMAGFAMSLEQVGIPFQLVSAYLCKTTEFFGGICLVLGFARPLAAGFMMINMLVATFIYNRGRLFDNGHTTFILLVCSLTIFFSAPDKLSVDWYISKPQT